MSDKEREGYEERLRNLNYQYIETPQFYDDLEHALSLVDHKDKYIAFLQKEKDLLKQTLITIGNIARLKDNIWLQEINKHVDDALEGLE